jgi:DNA-binding PucR family transcriptional regulator
MADYHSKSLREVLERLRGRPTVAMAIKRIETHGVAIADELRRAVLADVPQFSASRNPDLLPELARHSAQHVEELLRLLRGGSIGDFEFVRAHARRRAEQRFPLEATLHAYRSGHKVLSRWLRSAPTVIKTRSKHFPRDVAAIVDFAMEYTDAISTSFASAYSAHSALLADVAGDERAALLEALLAGRDEADPRVARMLRDAGFPNRQQTFCVALSRSVDPSEMLNAARARRLADAIEQLMADSPLRRIIDIRANKVTMVFSDIGRVSGWTQPRRSLAERVSELLQQVGNAALIGVSQDVPSTSHVPLAHRAASAALELADVTHRVVQFAEVPIQRLLLHVAGQEFRDLLPGWVGEFFMQDERARGALIATVRAYAHFDMNVLRVAQALGVHPNTIYARFERIFAITGLQPRYFAALATLLVVADCKPDGLRR